MKKISDKTIRNFKDIPGYLHFLRNSQFILVNTLKNFFSAENVRLHFEPLRELSTMYGIDIQQRIQRNVYILNTNQILLITHTNKPSDTSYILAILIESTCIGLYSSKKIFSTLSAAISNALQDSLDSMFRGGVVFLNENLIYRTIAKHIAKGAYDPYKINCIMQKFNTLRSTTFEGKYFSTGLIITKSIFDYKNQAKVEVGGTGTIFGLHYTTKIYEDIDTRYWYMVDGHSTFYLTDSKKDIHYMFAYKEKLHYDINRIIQSKVIKGRDIMFRTENGRDFSILTSLGIEYIYQENTWHYRDYMWLQNQITQYLQLSEPVYNALIHYVLYCSKNDLSSIIWIPKDFSTIDNYVGTKHAISHTSLKIQDPSSNGLLIRMLSSDGATIISADGEIKYYGGIATLKDVVSKKPKGTGETAASHLAQNGLAIKISQDGMIKIYMGNTKIKF